MVLVNHFKEIYNETTSDFNSIGKAVVNVVLVMIAMAIISLIVGVCIQGAPNIAIGF